MGGTHVGVQHFPQGARRRKQLPFFCYTFQLVDVVPGKFQPGSGRQVLDRPCFSHSGSCSASGWLSVAHDSLAQGHEILRSPGHFSGALRILPPLGDNFECDTSKQEIADEIVKYVWAPAYDAAVEAGTISQWGWG